MAQAVERGSWTPNWATHPGEHLGEYIAANGWSQADFARLAGLTPKLISTIVGGRNPVTPETALRLERVLGVKAQVWLGLQGNWDLFQVHAAEKAKAAEKEAWLARFPLGELKVRGILPQSHDTAVLLDALLAFFGVGSPDAFEAKRTLLAVHHRHAKAGCGSPEHVFSWLALGERQARRMALSPFDVGRFRSALDQIRALTLDPPNAFIPRMTELCRSSGVALVFEKPVGRTRLYGSARWLDGDHALIQMSLRMKTNDHFWWTFFHEAAHLLLHRGRNFADDEKGVGDGPEREADDWAADSLVGRTRFRDFVSGFRRSAAEVQAFANSIGLHPGIIVGMLQHIGALPHANLNGLKARVDWGDDARPDQAAAPPVCDSSTTAPVAVSKILTSL